MSLDLQIPDANEAKLVAKDHLRDQLPTAEIQKLAFTKVWFREQTRRDLWEVEGKVEMKKGILSSEVLSFKMQVDAETGNIMGFDRRKSI